MTELSQFGEFILEDIQLPENFEIIDVTQDYYFDPYTGCEGPAYNIAFNGLLNPGVYPISGTFKNIIYSDNFGQIYSDPVNFETIIAVQEGNLNFSMRSENSDECEYTVEYSSSSYDTSNLVNWWKAFNRNYIDSRRFHRLWF